MKKARSGSIRFKSVMRSAAGIVFLSLLAAGCSSSSLYQSSGSSPNAGGAPDLGDRIANFFGTGGSSRPQQVAGDPPPPEDIDCPRVTVRQGASTLALHDGREQTAMTLRYQGTIGRTARECRVVGKTVQMKIGVEGRIILGPAGGPGKVDVPLRFAVVREGPNPATVLTKDYRVAVTIEPGQSNVPFVQIDEELTIPLPSVSELNAYVVYVGYDPDVLKKKPPPRRRAAPKRRKT
jgi:hypothetical protein